MTQRLDIERKARTMTIDQYQDIIDVRDIIEELEDLDPKKPEDDERIEELSELLSELRDNGGDHKWEGHWYPVTLIRDSYFKDYAMELAEDLGAIPSEYSWPASYIDWDRAARDLQMDYTSVEFNGVTYWYR